MKKFVALMLAMVLVVGMASVAMADDSHLTTVKDLPLTEAYVMDIQKAYVNNDTGNSTAADPHPADVETFFVGDGTKTTDGGTATKAPEFYMNGVKKTDVTIPAITLQTDSISENAAIPQFHATLAASTDFTVPGEYVYYIYETIGSNKPTAGVTYNYVENPLILKITVINKTASTTVDGETVTVLVKDETTGKQILQIGGVALRLDNLNLKNANNSADKLDAADGNKDNVHNEYEFGKVTVTKTVSGNMANTDKPWIFKAEFTPASGETVRGTVDITGTGVYLGALATEPTGTENSVSNSTEVTRTIAPNWDTKQTVYFTLKHGQNMIFDNIPEGVTYTVTEVEESAYGYTTTKSNDTGTMTAAGDVTAAFTNTKNQTPDTGIALDAVPYVMIMAITLMGAAMMIVRRRKEDM
jgi:hypothetical protein